MMKRRQGSAEARLMKSRLCNRALREIQAGPIVLIL